MPSTDHPRAEGFLGKSTTYTQAAKGKFDVPDIGLAKYSILFIEGG